MNWTWIANNSDRIAELALAHVNLSWPAILLSFLLALPIGWAAHKFPKLRESLVVISSLLYAIPSLALFIVLPLIIGTSILSPLNVIAAMTLYGLALQIRTTADAFETVPDSARNAAIAIGYPAWKRWLSVELPLAGPVLLGGVRVVSASTISLVSVGALTGVASLGTLFTEGFQRSFTTEILVGIVATLLLAVLFDVLLVVLGKILMPWTRGWGLKRPKRSSEKSEAQTAEAYQARQAVRS